MSEYKHNPYCPYQDDEQLSLFCNCDGGEQYGNDEERVFPTAS